MRAVEDKGKRPVRPAQPLSAEIRALIEQRLRDSWKDGYEAGRSERYCAVCALTIGAFSGAIATAALLWAVHAW